MRCFKYPIAVLLFILLFAGPLKAELLVTLTPEAPTQGQALTFTLADPQATSAIFYYRVPGAGQYQQRYTSFQDQHAQIILNDSEVVAPGLQYYFKITRNGATVSSPQLYPQYSPHSIEVTSRAVFPVQLLSPDTKTPLRGKQLKIVLAGRQDLPRAPHYTIMLDSTDITPLVREENGQLIFSTDLLPAPGKHNITMIATDNSRRVQSKSWDFAVEDPQQVGTRQIYGKGNASFNYGFKLQEKSGSSIGDTMSANASMSFGANGKDWQTTWDGINIRYVKDAAPDELTIGAGFHFTATKGRQFLEYGDISIHETALTVPALSRRGIQAKLDMDQDKVNLFMANSASVQGWDSGLGDSDNYLRGFSWQRNWLPGNVLPITIVFSDGADRGGASYNTASQSTGSIGQIIGLAMKPVLGPVTIDFEIAESNFDKDTSDTVDKKNDLATTLGFSGRAAAFTLNGGFNYYGEDFGSVANPNFTSDRAGIMIGAATSKGASSFSFNGSHQRDNVGDDNGKPVVSSTSGALGWTFTEESLPALNLTYSRSDQNSSKEPVGSNPVNNSNDSLSGGISLSGENWNMSLSSNYSYLNDKTGNLDSEIYGSNLAANLTPYQDVSLAPALSFARSNNSSGVTDTTQVATLTVSTPLVPELITTNLQGSTSSNKASDNSTDSLTYNAGMRLALHLNRYFLEKFNYDGQQALALSINYNHLHDRITPANSRESYSIFLTLNLLSFNAPIEWSYGF